MDPIKELIQLIKQQRAFEMNSQSIQAADEVLHYPGPFGGRVCDALSQPTAQALVLVRGWVGG